GGVEVPRVEVDLPAGRVQVGIDRAAAERHVGDDQVHLHRLWAGRRRAGLLAQLARRLDPLVRQELVRHRCLPRSWTSANCRAIAGATANVVRGRGPPPQPPSAVEVVVDSAGSVVVEPSPSSASPLVPPPPRQSSRMLVIVSSAPSGRSSGSSAAAISL